MKIVRRLVALLLALVAIALFFVLALMMENEDSKRSDDFVVEANHSPLQPMAPLNATDSLTLSKAFGLAFPLPDGLTQGRVEDGRWHGYPTRLITLQGSVSQLWGIRPASAIGAILPPGADFKASEKALLGYDLMEARTGEGIYYSLMTRDAAFLIKPLANEEVGGFSMTEPAL